MNNFEDCHENHLSKNDFQNLENQTPETLKKGNHALHAQELAALSEGNVYQSDMLALPCNGHRQEERRTE